MTVTHRKPWTELLETGHMEHDDFAVDPELATSIKLHDEEVITIKEIITGQSQGQFHGKDADIAAKMWKMGATRAWEFLERVFMAVVHASLVRWRTQAGQACRAARPSTSGGSLAWSYSGRPLTSAPARLV